MRTVQPVLAICLAAAVLAACVDDRRYPVSGEECAPDDPVQTVDADLTDCIPTGL